MIESKSWNDGPDDLQGGIAMLDELARKLGEDGIQTLLETMDTARNVVLQGGYILFVGSGRTREAAVEAARVSLQHYVDRWTPGTLIRWDEHFKRLHFLESRLSADVSRGIAAPNLRRMKQELRRLEKSYRGVAPVEMRPDLIIVFDGLAERVAIDEARQVGIPVAALVENDADANGIDYPLRAEAGAQSFYGKMITLAACEGMASKIGFQKASAGLGSALFGLRGIYELFISGHGTVAGFDLPERSALPALPSFAHQQAITVPGPFDTNASFVVGPGPFAQQKLSDSFQPSDVLVGIFYEGLVSHSARLGRSPSGEVDPALWARAKETLGPRILESIASRARRMAAKVTPTRPLIAQGYFNYDFVLEISENIPFRRDASNPTFFEQLNLEITSFLARGGSISGRWGRLLLSEGAVEFDLAAPIAKPEDVWEKPKRVEWN